MVLWTVLALISTAYYSVVGRSTAAARAASVFTCLRIIPDASCRGRASGREAAAEGSAFPKSVVSAWCRPRRQPKVGFVAVSTISAFLCVGEQLPLQEMNASCAFASSSCSAVFTRSRLASSAVRRRARQPRPHRWLASSSEKSSASSAISPVPLVSPGAPPRRLRKGDRLDIEIKKLAYGGAAVGYVPALENIAGEDVGMPVYGPKGACPGEVVRCAITKVRRRSPAKSDPYIRHATPTVSRSYAEAIFVERLSASPETVPVPCSHFGSPHLGGGGCGGCSSLQVPYDLQLAQKQDQIETIFAKLCALHRVDVKKIRGCEKTLYYRNKMEFSFGRRWYEKDPRKSAVVKKNAGEFEYALGLHAPQRFDKVIQIDECHIQHPLGNEILRYIRERSGDLLLDPYDARMDEGYLRNIAIRSSRNAGGEVEFMVNFITSPCEVSERLKPLADEIVEKFPSVVCVVQNICGVTSQHAIDQERERLQAGTRNYLEQAVCGLTFRISANSFFQTNSEQAEVLYDEVRKAANLDGSETVLDLFCGTGTIGLSLAAEAKQVFGVDVVRAAVDDARTNASLNEIKNASFENGNLDKLKTLLKEKNLPKPDVIVVDPPRAGCHPDLVHYIAKSGARRVVYVSCNPVSQERDLQKLEVSAPGKFVMRRIQPVDMFPHTPHIECVCVLESRGPEDS